jgi:hypothetical protein
MTDNNGVNLTVQEAVSNEDVGHRNIAILPWQVIDRLNLSAGMRPGLPPMFTEPTSALVSYLIRRSAITKYR